MPDTAKLLAEFERAHPGLALQVDRTTTYSFQGFYSTGYPDSITRPPLSVTVVRLKGLDSAIVLGFVGNDSGEPRQFYNSGLLGGMDGCGALELSVPEVRIASLRDRPILIVVERHFYPACVDDEMADTSTAHFYDGSREFRQILTAHERVVRMTVVSVPCEAQCWRTDTLRMSTSYFDPDDNGFGVQDVSTVGVDTLPIARYKWNRDSTRLVAEWWTEKGWKQGEN